MAEAEFMHRWFEEIWNNQNEAIIDEMFAEDGVGYGLGPEPIVGPENFKTFHRAFVSAYPDLKVHVEDTQDRYSMSRDGITPRSWNRFSSYESAGRIYGHGHRPRSRRQDRRGVE